MNAVVSILLFVCSWRSKGSHTHSLLLPSARLQAVFLARVCARERESRTSKQQYRKQMVECFKFRLEQRQKSCFYFQFFCSLNALLCFTHSVFPNVTLYITFLFFLYTTSSLCLLTFFSLLENAKGKKKISNSFSFCFFLHLFLFLSNICVTMSCFLCFFLFLFSKTLF